MPDLTLEWSGAIEAKLIGSQPDGYFFTVTNTVVDDFYDLGWDIVELRHVDAPATVIDTVTIAEDFERVSLGCETVTLIGYNGPGFGTLTVLRVSAAGDVLTVDTVATGLPNCFGDILLVEPGGTQFAYQSRTGTSPSWTYSYEIVDIATGTVTATVDPQPSARYLLAMPAPDRLLRYNGSVNGHELLDDAGTVLDFRDRSDFAPQANGGNANGDWGYNATVSLGGGVVFSGAYSYDPDYTLSPIVATIDCSADTLNFTKEPQGYPVTTTDDTGWWWSTEIAASGNRVVWTWAGENDVDPPIPARLFVLNANTYALVAQSPETDSLAYGTRSIQEGDLGIAFAGDYIIHAPHPLTSPFPNVYRDWTVWKIPTSTSGAGSPPSLRQRQTFIR